MKARGRAYTDSTALQMLWDERASMEEGEDEDGVSVATEEVESLWVEGDEDKDVGGHRGEGAEREEGVESADDVDNGDDDDDGEEEGEEEEDDEEEDDDNEDDDDDDDSIDDDADVGSDYGDRESQGVSREIEGDNDGNREGRMWGSDGDTVCADESSRAFVEDVLKRERALDSSRARTAIVDGLFGPLEDWDEEDTALLEVCYARVKTVVEVMRAARRDEGMQERGCHLMGAIAGRRPGLIRWMVDAGSVGAVLEAMAEWEQGVVLQERALGALRAFTVVDAMRKAVMIAGGVEHVMRAMRQHKESVRVQDRGATVLANVSFGCPHRKRKIGRAGGLAQIVTAMLSHPNDPDIQLRGSLAIRNLTYHSQVNQYLAGREGAVEAVASALLAFPAHSLLRYQAIVALTNLSVDDKGNRQRILEYGYDEDPESPEKKSALRGILRTMRRESGNPFLLEHGLALLYHLSIKQPDAQDRIGELGGIGIAVRAIEKNMGLPSLLMKACSLIRTLCFMRLNRDRVSEHIDVLLSVIESHAQNPHVVIDAMSALSNTIYNHEDNRAVAGTKGAVETLIRAMSKETDSIRAQEESCRALRYLVENNVENAMLLAEAGGVEAVATVLSVTSACDTREKCMAQDQAVCLLADLGRSSPTLLRRIVETAVADFIENALAKLPEKSHQELHQVGDALLEDISAYEKKLRGSEGTSVNKTSQGQSRRVSTVVNPSARTFRSLVSRRRHRHFKERKDQNFQVDSRSFWPLKSRRRNNGRRRTFGLRKLFTI